VPSADDLNTPWSAENVTVLEDSALTIKARASQPMDSAKKQFLRLRVLLQ